MGVEERVFDACHPGNRVGQPLTDDAKIINRVMTSGQLGGDDLAAAELEEVRGHECGRFKIKIAG